ncbi:hypothetical protein [Noviherbaspirillum saxi]|uniref:Uncharacterized protein n=1 Tax=Noviherbaspirillum saxi TaxID=2320863 RepID=A0A3A3FT03_9BURK|nr:hypothetical protein [Noviherbaspirillum saxi]RJF99312.1 hypothetical protein D3871_12870 [Noviherbaspirillum saxi]
MRRRIAVIATIAGAVLLSGMCAAHAALAAWHIWRSLTDGGETCAQNSPGAGWERVAGPYKDARCTIPGKPG